MLPILTNSQTALSIIMVCITIVGAICLAVFALPNLVQTIKNKQTQYISYWLYTLLGIGAGCFAITSYYNAFSGEIDFISLIIGISNTFSSSASIILVVLKTIHIKQAKMKKLSEVEYCKSIAPSSHKK
ncbi:MAG: hypothetical protein LBV22_01785 [Mycoplasmataceae bacterium]|jgi:uncharacterized protein with PQ loop repeat|nr:hypothetical protein [Mycoplasmataceae bacterium]